MNKDYYMTKKEFLSEIGKLLSVEDIRISTILSDISNAISTARIKKKMNQKELSELLEISQSMVSKLESGGYNFTIESMVNVLTALDIDFEILIGKSAIEYTQDRALDSQDWKVTLKRDTSLIDFPSQLAHRGA